MLKDGGKAELDALVAVIAKRGITVGSVVVAGHVDRLEARNAAASLAEDRAQSVVSYLSSKGIERTIIFWEGKGDKEPLPITKFCE